MRYPLRRRLERLAYERWARRGFRTLLRAAWIGLSVLCIGLGLHMVLDWTIQIETLIALALGCIAIGAVFLLRPRMSAQEVARRLDQRFGLDEQMTTALEVSASPEPAEGVAQRLLEQCQATTGQVQTYVTRNRRQPWSDVWALLAVALVALGLFLILGLAPFGVALQPPEVLPQLAELPPEDDPLAEEVPPDTPGEETAPTGPEQAQVGELADAALDQQAMESLANALRDQSATRPAAEALDQGDAEAAAQALRELADQADLLSDDTRRDLAEQLRQAAGELGTNDPELAEDLRDSAYEMQQDGQGTADALENLAEAVENMGESDPPPQQAQAPQQQQQQAPQQQQQQNNQNQSQGGGAAGNAPSPPGEQRERPNPAERLGVEGVPLELESNGEDGGSSSEGEPETTAPGGGGSFATSDEGEPDDQTVQLDEDPLRIPADLRDVVQEYFSPGS